MKKITISHSITNKESESIERYFKEINNIKLLTKQEEIDLARKIKENINDIKSINKLIISNLRFVITVAKQFQNQGLTIEDLISEGNIGLIEAAKRFDDAKGFKFISYAVWWIRQSILEALSEHSRIIRLPLNQINNISKVKKILDKLEQEHERVPSDGEISDILNIKFEKVGNYLRLNGKCVSIDEPIKSGNSESYTLSDVIENKESLVPDSFIYDRSLTTQIDRSLEVLNEREKEIIMKFFGLNNHDRMTLVSLGREYGLSKERIRQIKSRAIRKIRFNYREL